MARTKQDLAQRVAEELQLVGEGVAPDHADAEAIKKRYDDKLADLEEQDLAYWPANDIPAAAMEGLVMVIADICAPVFGLPRDVGRYQLGMSRLREHTAILDTGEPVTAIYY